MSRHALDRLAHPDRGGPARPRPQGGFLSLELLFVLPVLALLAVLLFTVAAVGRDLLVLHEGARAAARAAATSTDDAQVRRIAEAATPELSQLSVLVLPRTRQDGDLVQVTLRTRRAYGPLSQSLRATATARVEPGIGGGGP